MNLIDLITYFRANGNQDDFYKTNAINPEAEVIEIYMEMPLHIDAKIAFFEIEKTEGKVAFEYEKVLYHNITDFYFFIDFIEESKSNHKLSNKKLAETLLSYAINDA